MYCVTSRVQYLCSLVLSVPGYKWNMHRLIVLYKNIDQKLVKIITQTFELWNRWIRLSCYYNRVKNTCPLYTHVSPILQCVGPYDLFCGFRSILVYNTWMVKKSLYLLC